MNGTYTYKHQTYVSGIRTYVEHSMRVAVVAEKGNRYRVKYLGFHANGSLVNSLHWVRKDSVRLDNTKVDPAKVIVRPPLWIDDLGREIRSPYKD